MGTFVKTFRKNDYLAFLIDAWKKYRIDSLRLNIEIRLLIWPCTGLCFRLTKMASVYLTNITTEFMGIPFLPAFKASDADHSDLPSVSWPSMPHLTASMIASGVSYGKQHPPPPRSMAFGWHANQ